MGNKYYVSDISNVIQTLKSQSENYKHLIDSSISPFNSLIESVNAHQLSGQTWEKMAEVCQEIFLQTFTNAKQELENLDSSIDKLSSAQSAVEYPELDEDKLNERLSFVNSRIAIYQIESMNPIHLDWSAEDALIRLENFQAEASEINKKLEQLHTFVSATSDLFVEENLSFKNLTNLIQQIKGGGFTSLGQYVSSKHKVLDIKQLSTTSKAADGWLETHKGNAVLLSNIERWGKANKTNLSETIQIYQGSENLKLPSEAQDYYMAQMSQVLTKVPTNQWSKTIPELNDCLLFDDDGNILSMVGNVNVGNGSGGLVILKNGVYDSELSSQADREFTSAQKEAFKENFPQILSGFLTMLGGAGLGAIDFGGTVFSGGTLALAGVSESVGAVSLTTTASGAVTLADAISKINLDSGQVDISFAKNYDDYVGGIKRTGRQKGNAPRSASAQNKQANDIAKKYKLNKDQQDQFHNEVTGQGYGYKELEEIAEDIKNGK